MSYLSQLLHLQPNSISSQESLISVAKHSLSERSKNLLELAAFRIALDTAMQPMIVSDKDGNFIMWNQEARLFSHLENMDTPPEEWSQHFEVFGLDGSPIPIDELPLLVALREEERREGVYFVNSPGRGREKMRIRAHPVMVDGTLWGGILWWSVLNE